MLKKLNNLLNVVIGTSVGVFIGHAGFIYWEHHQYAELYAMQSSPWYTSIIVYGVMMLTVILIASILKFIVQRKMNKC